MSVSMCECKRESVRVRVSECQYVCERECV